MTKLKLAYLVTHPIQYQAPLLRLIAAEPDIDLTVFFGTDFTARTFTAEEFGQTITWDVPLLEGYRHVLLPRVIEPKREKGKLEPLDFVHPLSRGFARHLSAEKFDALWIHGYAHWTHIAAMFSARRRGIPVLLRDEATSISAARSLPKRIAKRAFFSMVSALVDRFLSIGTLNKRYYVENGIAEDRIALMPYAVDNSRFQAQAAAANATRAQRRAALGLAPDQPALLFAAKLIERKRPALLIDAFARVLGDPGMRNPVLLLCGDGPQRAELEARASALPKGAVRFLGFKGQAELPEWYDLCDAFVLPSGQESWGLVVNEAMNAGRAIIASDRIGSAVDLVVPGRNGAIFRCDDVADFARAIAEVIGDPARLAAMGRESLALINRWDFAADIVGLRAALAAVCPGRLAAAPA